MFAFLCVKKPHITASIFLCRHVEVLSTSSPSATHYCRCHHRCKGGGMTTVMTVTVSFLCLSAAVLRATMARHCHDGAGAKWSVLPKRSGDERTYIKKAPFSNRGTTTKVCLRTFSWANVQIQNGVRSRISKRRSLWIERNEEWHKQRDDGGWWC